MQVEQPSFMRSKLFPPVFVAAVLALGFLAYNLYYAPFMKNLALWVFGVLVVYWFSVSGGMHNIIRGVPMYYPDQDGKIKVSPPSALYHSVAYEEYACMAHLSHTAFQPVRVTHVCRCIHRRLVGR